MPTYKACYERAAHNQQQIGMVCALDTFCKFPVIFGSYR